jgi:hypothetical protein
METVSAKFDEREFLVTGSSPNLEQPPALDWPLLPYLNVLSQTGWKTVRGRFDGWGLILDLERQADTSKKYPTYMMLLLHQISSPKELLSTAADSHMKLLNELHAVRVKEGWEIIAGPKHFSSIKGMWTVALWVKDSLETDA